MIDTFILGMVWIVTKFSLKIKLLSSIFSNFVIELDKDIDNTSYFVIFLAINIVS